MTLKIGLTGGIGSGKSEVADQFAALDVPVIDTDLISRELVAPGQPALTEIVTRFGSTALQANGQLNRAALRRRVFRDAAARRDLETILHARIRAEVVRRSEALAAPYVIVVVPLLFEAGFDDLVDTIVVVDTPEFIQLQRVLARDGGDPQAIERIVAAQLPRAERLRRADLVIDNSGGREDLKTQVRDLHARFITSTHP